MYYFGFFSRKMVKVAPNICDLSYICRSLIYQPIKVPNVIFYLKYTPEKKRSKYVPHTQGGSCVGSHLLIGFLHVNSILFLQVLDEIGIDVASQVSFLLLFHIGKSSILLARRKGVKCRQLPC